MTTCLGKSCSFGLPRVPFVNCCHFMYLVISRLVLRAGCGILLYQFLISAYLFTLSESTGPFGLLKLWVTFVYLLKYFICFLMYYKTKKFWKGLDRFSYNAVFLSY